eukprot:jgi/Mesvir1/5329/Mv15419-RA.1
MMSARSLLHAGAGFGRRAGVRVDSGGAQEAEESEIPIEPFNLRQERKDGYFDADGNYVEYRLENDLKDAWLDSAEVDPSLAEKAERENAALATEREELSRAEMAAIKRRIADTLLEGETVLRALKRLGGHRPAKKPGQGGKAAKGGKGAPATEVVGSGHLPGDGGGPDMDAFNRLTEDANALLVAGEYDVYSDTKESFDREASGYEAILAMNASKERRDVGSSTTAMASAGTNKGAANGGPGVPVGKGGGTLAESLQQSSFEEDMFADDPMPARPAGGGGEGKGGRPEGGRMPGGMGARALGRMVRGERRQALPAKLTAGPRAKAYVDVCGIVKTMYTSTRESATTRTRVTIVDSAVPGTANAVSMVLFDDARRALLEVERCWKAGEVIVLAVKTAKASNYQGNVTVMAGNTSYVTVKPVPG